MVPEQNINPPQSGGVTWRERDLVVEIERYLIQGKDEASSWTWTEVFCMGMGAVCSWT